MKTSAVNCGVNMRKRYSWISIIILFSLLPFTYGGCGSSGGGSGGNDDKDWIGSNPDGLKIFVSASLHDGDFANDPTLTGLTAIEKADDFCMRDANLPADGSIYKALLVDGVNRDAVTLTDWVLQPNTTYYRPSGVEIDTTSDDAIFLAFFRDMKNSIGEDTGGPFQSAWTGIVDVSDFSTNAASHCFGWSSPDIADIGDFGSYIAKNSVAFSWPGNSVCSNLWNIYCVEQP